MTSSDEDRRTPPATRPGGQPAPAASSQAEVDAFIAQAQAMAPARTAGRRGRLIFAMDATMSRQPTWDLALGLQAEMFAAVEAAGGLDVQLVYFRGLGECRASRWVSQAGDLARLMASVRCQGGATQIGRVLDHALQEGAAGRVDALVLVGDAMEEKADALAVKAGELGLVGLRAFLFQEGRDQAAEATFRELARLTGGAYCRFAPGAAEELRQLLRAVAAYAAGGRAMLEDAGRGQTGEAARLLLGQIR